jgi:acyl-CoA thioesterase FadM
VGGAGLPDVFRSGRSRRRRFGAARTTREILAPVRVGDEHVITAWPISVAGRKRIGGTALHSADGTLCAVAEGLWIERV